MGAPYTSGRPNSGGTQLKCKFYATASFIVAAVNKQRSVLLVLMEDGSRSVYEPGKRTGKWQKFKLYLEEELFIGGFIPSGQGGVESVVLGKREGAKLRYVACLDVRMPLSESLNAAKKLNALKVARSPFPEIPKRKPGNSWSGGMTEQEQNTAVWAEPKHTAEVTFLEWTRSGFLRHAQVKALSVC